MANFKKRSAKSYQRFERKTIRSETDKNIVESEAGF